MYNYNQQYSVQQNMYSFVNGIEGAKAYQVMPNQTVILIDSESSMLYVKQANAIGQATIQYFKLTQINNTEMTSEYITRDEFNKAMEELKNGKSNTTINESASK